MDINDYKGWGIIGMNQYPSNDINWYDAYTTFRATRDAHLKAFNEYTFSSIFLVDGEADVANVILKLDEFYDKAREFKTISKTFWDALISLPLQLNEGDTFDILNVGVDEDIVDSFYYPRHQNSWEIENNVTPTDKNVAVLDSNGKIIYTILTAELHNEYITTLGEMLNLEKQIMALFGDTYEEVGLRVYPSINGYVYDIDGNPVADAVVTVLDYTENFSINGTTDNNGYYSITSNAVKTFINSLPMDIDLHNVETLWTDNNGVDHYNFEFKIKLSDYLSDGITMLYDSTNPTYSSFYGAVNDRGDVSTINIILNNDINLDIRMTELSGTTTTTTTEFPLTTPIVYLETANYIENAIYGEKGDIIGYTWNDVEGNYDGILRYGTTYVDNVISFDGIDDYVDMSTIPDTFWNAGSWTVSSWVKFNNVNRGSYDDNGILGHGLGGNNMGLQLGERQGNPMFAFWNNDLQGNTILSNGVWYNLVFTYDNLTGDKKIYVNGTLDATGYGSYSGTGNNTMFANQPFGENRGLDGYLNSVKLYNVVLSEIEINQLYQLGTVTPTTTTTTTLPQLITFTKANYGTDVDVVSQYLTLKRGNSQGLFNTNEGSTYGDTFGGGVNHLWCIGDFWDASMRTPHGGYPMYNNYTDLWNTFDPSTIDISQLVSDYDGLSPLTAVMDNYFHDKPMVPWAIAHESSPPNMLNKEAIMLDVQDQKFYKVKFTQWSSNNGGGGLSYTRQLIV